ncbi:MAG: hypothetical protein F6J97_21295 [Leptolyngbya sp. SIO4C1]|nr:hypothetical protein [Leptolyngbya sp. SIO4C1]
MRSYLSVKKAQNAFQSFILTADMIPRKITFRLQPDEAKQLYYQARDSDISSHRMARDIVIERMTLADMEQSLQDMADELEALRNAYSVALKRLDFMQVGLIDTLAVILSNQVEKVSDDQAREWVRERFGIHE